MSLPKDTRIGFLAPIEHPIPPVGYGPQAQDIVDIISGLQDLGYQDITLYGAKSHILPGVKTVAIVDEPYNVTPQPEFRQIEWMHIAHSLAAAQTQVDIIHNHHNFLPLHLKELNNVPTVTTLHGAGVERDAKLGFMRVKSEPYIAISDYERTLVPELNYVTTIFNPIDFEIFSPVTAPGGEYLASISRIDPTKGVHHAIAIAKALGRVLHLAGPVAPHMTGYFNSEVKPHIDGTSVVYHGNLTASEVRNLVGGAAGLIAMTDWPEPFGRSVVEAMACGTPVIGSARGAHLETITPGVTGILADSVETAISQFKSFLAIDRAECRRFAETRFGIPAIAQAHADAFAKVLGL